MENEPPDPVFNRNLDMEAGKRTSGSWTNCFDVSIYFLLTVMFGITDEEVLSKTVRKLNESLGEMNT